MFFKRSADSLAEPWEATPGAALMSLRGVEKSFPVGAGQTFVLRRIAADIKPGEFVSIMGPSGAGKSTLLHIMGLHDGAWSGEYYLMGHGIHALSIIAHAPNESVPLSEVLTATRALALLALDLCG